MVGAKNAKCNRQTFTYVPMVTVASSGFFSSNFSSRTSIFVQKYVDLSSSCFGNKCILSCVPAFPALELFTLVSRAFFCVPPCVRNNAKDESKKSSLQSITEKRPDVKRHIGCQMKLIDLQKGFLRVVYQAFVLS